MFALRTPHLPGQGLGHRSEWPQGRCGAVGPHRIAARRALCLPPGTQTSSGVGPASCPSPCLPRPPRGGCGRPRQAAVVSRSSLSTVETLGRQLTADEEATWKASGDALSGALGLSSEESGRVLARAFGWTTQAFWRREKVEELPMPGQVVGALGVLQQDLGLSSEEAAKVVRLFPEVLACDVEGRLRTNIAQLKSQWRLQGPTLAKAVLRQPAVLGYSLDCGGDCIGECNRCWARF
ncbi:hypothetical protein PLESTB_000133700 [Pleodorina starrii]|uniref:Uncharacterized protein n=1 Tax=Pleodorina starrii TaxID=330485 RepID=A0A9W6BAV3_9CHLO|nr:hypothetical protein PLESTM_002077600 [Pleodorina starrii]GLC48759.1 hypothetical protein PLESTB_000133700 [Pleodorina starrii]GLC74304.1 hypothetical protein PLESTF_001487100 [Pleodorina starrii]